MSDPGDSADGGWSLLSPEEYAELLEMVEEDLRGSWPEGMEPLEPGEAAVGLENFATEFVVEEHVEEFLDSFRAGRQLPMHWFRDAKEVHPLVQLDECVEVPLGERLEIEVHYTVPDRALSFLLYGTPCELMRVFALQGPAVARCVSATGVGWLSNRDGQDWVLRG